MKKEEDSANQPDHEPIRRRGEDNGGKDRNNNYHIHQKSRRNKQDKMCPKKIIKKVNNKLATILPITVEQQLGFTYEISEELEMCFSQLIDIN